MTTSNETIQQLSKKIHDLLVDVVFLKELREEHRKTIKELETENRQLKTDNEHLKASLTELTNENKKQA